MDFPLINDLPLGELDFLTPLILLISLHKSSRAKGCTDEELVQALTCRRLRPRSSFSPVLAPSTQGCRLSSLGMTGSSATSCNFCCNYFFSFYSASWSSPQKLVSRVPVLTNIRRNEKISYAFHNAIASQRKNFLEVLINPKFKTCPSDDQRICERFNVKL